MEIDYDPLRKKVKFVCDHREAAAVLASLEVCADSGIKECSDLLDGLNYMRMDNKGNIVKKKHRDFFGKKKRKPSSEKIYEELPDIEVTKETEEALTAALNKFKGNNNEDEKSPKEPKEE